MLTVWVIIKSSVTIFESGAINIYLVEDIEDSKVSYLEGFIISVNLYNYPLYIRNCNAVYFWSNVGFHILLVKLSNVGRSIELNFILIWWWISWNTNINNCISSDYNFYEHVARNRTPHTTRRCRDREDWQYEQRWENVQMHREGNQIYLQLLIKWHTPFTTFTAYNIYEFKMLN